MNGKTLPCTVNDAGMHPCNVHRICFPKVLHRSAIHLTEPLGHGKTFHILAPPHVPLIWTWKYPRVLQLIAGACWFHNLHHLRDAAVTSFDACLAQDPLRRNDDVRMARVSKAFETGFCRCAMECPLKILNAGRLPFSSHTVCAKTAWDLLWQSTRDHAWTAYTTRSGVHQAVANQVSTCLVCRIVIWGLF